jgi:hypothetical protein
LMNYVSFGFLNLVKPVWLGQLITHAIYESSVRIITN